MKYRYGYGGYVAVLFEVLGWLIILAAIILLVVSVSGCATTNPPCGDRGFSFNRSSGELICEPDQKFYWTPRTAPLSELAKL